MKYDINKTLIMILDKNTYQWIDKTTSVVWYSEDDRSVRIKFVGSDNFYRKSYRDIHIINNPEIINDVKSNIYIKGRIARDVKKILLFGGSFYRIFFHDGSSRVYQLRDIEFSYDIKENRQIFRFEYFYDLLLRTSGDQNSFLLQQYEDINPFSSQTVLLSYLKRTEVKKTKTESTVIYPFGFNLSQKDAVERGLSHNISIIEGPPGTGKTQTILNLICNFIIRKKTIAVVSNNNAAITNVRDKLDEMNFGFISALLGNKENKTIFFENDYSKDKPLDYLDNNINDKEYESCLEQIRNYQTQIPLLFEYENKLADKRIELGHFETEYQQYLLKNKITNTDLPKKFIKKYNSIKKIMEFKVLINKEEKLSWIQNLFMKLKYDINFNDRSNNSLNTINRELDLLYYSLRINDTLTLIS